jgi:polyisoprenoid-binding protein YceI
MKSNAINWTVGTALALALTTSAVAADTWVKLGSKPGGKVRMDGTSSIHDWYAESAIIRGTFEVEPEFLTDKSLKSVKSLTTKEVNPKAELAIPVRSLKSSSGQKMDEITQEAMNMKEHRDIVYKLKEMVLKGEADAAGNAKFDTVGDLTVAGKAQPCAMVVGLERMDGGRFKFSGETKLKMTDFGIAPPSPKIPGMAEITTGDEVTVKFEWVVGTTTAAK